jgi:hypothetical protein
MEVKIAIVDEGLVLAQTRGSDAGPVEESKIQRFS